MAPVLSLQKQPCQGRDTLLAQCPSALFLPQSRVYLHAQLWQEIHTFTPAKLTCHKRHCTGGRRDLGEPASWSPETPPLLNRLQPATGAEAAALVS